MQKVVRSTIVDAPIERVWAVLRDFNSHDQWHAVVEHSDIEAGERSDQVGCVRSFTLRDGNRIREQLLSLDDREHRSTYCIVDATVPLLRYVATLTLKPVTDGNRTFWHWQSTFATPPGREAELREMVARDVYEAGFANLRAFLDHGAANPAIAPGAGLSLPARRSVLRHYGSADGLQGEDAEVGTPGPGEVRIRQRAIGVNYFDIYLRRGLMPSLLPLPGTPGMEAAGSVVDVGAGVADVLAGDRVAYLGPLPGAYCTVRNVPADWLVRLPTQVEDTTAAALLLKGCTAHFLLHDLGHVREGTRVLVHAAAGGLGLLLCAWARSLGATVIGTASSEAKARIARDHGCQHLIVGANAPFADTVQRLGGAQLIIDGIGAAAAEQNLQALARGGHWVSIGQASGSLPALSPDALLHKSATFSRPVVFDFVASRAELASRAQALWDALADGRVKCPPIEAFTLDAAAQAHARLESRASVGALVLLP